MNVIATIEARTGSTRLPGKILKPILGEPMLSRITERAKRSELIDTLIIATTVHKRDEVIAELAEKLGIACFRGSEDDILARLAGAISPYEADVLVSLTGDNPFIDPVMIDDMVRFLGDGQYDYVASTHMRHAETWDAERDFPAGVTAQIVYTKHVRDQNEEVTDNRIREMGLYSIYERTDGRYKRGAFKAVGKYAHWHHPGLRLTVDTPEDFVLAEKIYERLYTRNPNFSTLEAINLILNNEDLRTINQHVQQKIAYQELKNPC